MSSAEAAAAASALTTERTRETSNVKYRESSVRYYYSYSVTIHAHSLFVNIVKKQNVNVVELITTIYTDNTVNAKYIQRTVILSIRLVYILFYVTFSE